MLTDRQKTFLPLSSGHCGGAQFYLELFEMKHQKAIGRLDVIQKLESA